MRHSHPVRSPLFRTASGGLILALACGGGMAYESGGGSGWGDEPAPPTAQDMGDTGDEADSGALEDSAIEGDTADTAEEADCDDQTPVVLYMSPDDSNSMSSPVQARAAVLGGWSTLDNVAIRGWEFMNYYDFAYQPAAEDSLALSMELEPAEEGAEDRFALQIAVASPRRSNEERELMNLTFVLDTSGSMSGDPLDMLQEVLVASESQLRRGDIVNVVTWASSDNVVLSGHVHQGQGDQALAAVAQQLSASGSTNLYNGLETGYELAWAHYAPERINRLILVSDGGANAGITELDMITAQTSGNEAEGIYLVGVGVGSAQSYHDTLMEAVTDAGKGASVFIDSSQEAWKIFSERFVNTMDVAARDVQLELELPPGFEILRYSGEGYSSDPTELDPQHIAPNDAMVFYNLISTCAPDLLGDDTEITVTVRFEDAVTSERRQVSLSRSLAELYAGDTALLRKGAAVYAYAEALKAVIHSPGDNGANTALSAGLELLELAELANPGDADLAEIRQVLEALQVDSFSCRGGTLANLGLQLRRSRAMTAWEELGMGGGE